MRRQIVRILSGLILFGLSGVASSDSITISDFNQLFRDAKDSNTFRFFQAGFDEGAFVMGFFRGVDLNSDGAIEYRRYCATPTCEDPEQAVTYNDTTNEFEITTDIPEEYDTLEEIGFEFGLVPSIEVTDFALFFSGNSLVDPFLLGIEALTSPTFDDGDRARGLVYQVGSRTIPSSSGQPVECGFLGDCPGVLNAGGWEFFVYQGEIADAPYGPRYSNGGYGSGDAVSRGEPGAGISFSDIFVTTGNTSTDHFLRVMRVPEPGTLALLGIGLAGMGLSRRRKQLV